MIYNVNSGQQVDPMRIRAQIRHLKLHAGVLMSYAASVGEQSSALSDARSHIGLLISDLERLAFSAERTRR